MKQWRHQLHLYPELAFEVTSTAATVADQLRAFGLDEVHEGIGRSGVVGVLRRGTSSTMIGLRADMDALPIQEHGDSEHQSRINGVFHGCGHDGHTSMLLGAAKHLSTNGSFDGTVVFVFQPDEENGRGAQAMIDDGLLDRFLLSAIYGLHNTPGIPAGHFATRVGPMMSSEDLFEITIRGRGGHASVPQHHVDPIVIGAEIIQALQTIVSRSVAATDTAVVSVTELITDGARNIVPSNVIIRGDCRTFSTDVQHRIEQRMGDLVDGICGAHGASGHVEYRNEFVPLVNTGPEVDAALGAAGAVAGPEGVDGTCGLVTASEDFARYLHLVPGCFITIGNGRDGVCGQSLHHPNYDFNDEILAAGSSYWVELVESQLPAAA
ncbi:MAG: amidohydrolase [Actinomycetia bacterium]|nr:amidohydrolase [Actinomycetes bacterium]